MSDRVERALKEWSDEEHELYSRLKSGSKKNQSHAHLRPAVKAFMKKYHSATARELTDANLIPPKPDGSCWTVTELWNNILVHFAQELGFEQGDKIKDGKRSRYYTSKYVREDEEAKPPFNTVNEVMISYIIDAVKDDLEAGNEINIYDLLDENRDIFPAIYKGTKGDRNTNRQQMMEKLTTEFTKGYSYTRIKKGIFITNVASHKGEK